MLLKMGYRALYRVWRPQQFADLVGQQLITQTLKNAIAAGQTSHAYLFTGPRGTGKTSAAKIFAKAINCQHQQAGEPCNKCEICQAITQGRLNDVIEIDAASNNSVDEVRDIREKVKYAPTQAQFKVYIIDEVHMLSAGAFNALLKTLEEPPANVVFILATTEPYKIPATIISRTQRFDFRRIEDQDLIERMEYILSQEKLEFDPAALQIIAKAAAGGMRDALSMLDQVLSFGHNQVNLENALLVTGSVSQEQLAVYLEAVFSQKAAIAFQQLQQLLSAGKDPNQLFEGLIDYCRQLLLTQVEKNSTSEKLTELADQVSAETLYQALDILSQQQQAMRFATHQDVYLDVATIKLCRIAHKDDVDASAAATEKITELQTKLTQMQQQLSRLQAQSQQGEDVQQLTPQTKRARTSSQPKLKVKPDLNKIYAVLATASRASLVEVKDVWQDLLSMLAVTQRAVMNVSQPVAASADAAVVSFQYDFLFEKAAQDQQLQNALTADLAKLLGKDLRLVFLPQAQWPQVRKKYLVDHQNDGEPKNGDESPATPDNNLTTAEKIWGTAAKNLIELKDD